MPDGWLLLVGLVRALLRRSIRFRLLVLPVLSLISIVPPSFATQGREMRNRSTGEGEEEGRGIGRREAERKAGGNREWKQTSR